MSQTNSEKTYQDDQASHTTRSVGESKNQRRRRGDRSKGETAGPTSRVKKILPKNLGANTVVGEWKQSKPVNIQPVLLMEPTLPKEEKVLDQSQATDSNKIVDFANLLLAKHEANMRKREQEGLYSPINNKQSEVSSSPGVA